MIDGDDGISGEPFAAGSARAVFEGAAAYCEDDATRFIRGRLQEQLGAVWSVGERIGRGGMGIVFRARQTRLGRDVAIKVLVAPSHGLLAESASGIPPGGSAEPDWGGRFLREARALARLAHQGIVTIFDFGEADGLAWIVMELVEGTSLRILLQGEALPPEEALGVAAQICEALEYAHGQGVVHRDIKPENILLSETGAVKLVDFGLAKLNAMEGEIQLTRTDHAMGTVRYMAPEQLDAPKTVDHRADVYAVGVVVYEMLTGHVPQGVIESPSRSASVSKAVDRAVLKALERRPETRLQSVAALAASWESDAHSITSPAAHTTAVGGGGRWRPASSQRRDLRPGFFFDAIVFLAGAALLLTLIAPRSMMYGEVVSQVWVLAGLVLLFFGPILLGAIKRDRNLPLARVVFGLVATTWVVGNGVIDIGGALAYARAWWFDVPLALSLIQISGGAFTRACPTGLRWSAHARTTFHWVAVAISGAAALLTVPAGTETIDDQTSQIVPFLIFTFLAIELLRRRRSHQASTTSRIRSLCIATLGLLTLFALLDPRVDRLPSLRPQLLLLVSFVALVVGSLEGAGTRANDGDEGDGSNAQ